MDMDIMQYIDIDQSVMMGKPVIRGTRIAVEIILERFIAGETIEDIQTAYPHISQEAIRAAILFVHSVLRMAKTLLLVVNGTDNGPTSPGG